MDKITVETRVEIDVSNMAKLKYRARRSLDDAISALNTARYAYEQAKEDLEPMKHAIMPNTADIFSEEWEVMIDAKSLYDEASDNVDGINDAIAIIGNIILCNGER